MRRPLYILCASGLIALIACPPAIKQVKRSDVEMDTVSSIYVPCTLIADCNNKVAELGLTCTTVVGCANGECQFSLPNPVPPNCECYDHDVRLCPSDDTMLQFCVKKVPDGASWQRDASGNVCGPRKRPCTTGKEACPDGFGLEKFNSNIDQWVATGECVPEPSCPPPGTQRPCQSENPNCPNGVQTWDGNVWDVCQAVGCPKIGAKQPCDTGDPKCRFGFRAWNGTDWGPCVADSSPNTGNTCGHCGGTLACDGLTCSRPDPGNYGADCEHCDGTIGCDGVTCSKHDPANYGAACGCGNRGKIGCTGSCDGGACDSGKVCTASGQCCVSNQGARCGCGGRGVIDCNGTCANGQCPQGKVCNPDGTACILKPCLQGQKRCGLGACGNFCCSGPTPPNGAGGLPCDVPCTRDPESGKIMCQP